MERRSPLSEEDPLGADSWSVAEEDWAELPPDADFDSERATPKPPAPGRRKPAPSDPRVSRIVHSVAWDRAPVETALEDHLSRDDAADDEPEYAGEESEWAERFSPKSRRQRMNSRVNRRTRARPNPPLCGGQRGAGRRLGDILARPTGR